MFYVCIFIRSMSISVGDRILIYIVFITIIAISEN